MGGLNQMTLDLFIITALTVLTVNSSSQEKVNQPIQHIQTSKIKVYKQRINKHKYKYNCTYEGIKLMLHDKLEDQTIAAICKDLPKPTQSGE
jgi:DNA polymerase III alpha subunit